jgi:uncharacterized protein
LSLQKDLSPTLWLYFDDDGVTSYNPPIAPGTDPGAFALADDAGRNRPHTSAKHTTHNEMDLHNETGVNVAALLQEPMGSSRSYPLHLDAFPLDDELLATNVSGTVKLTRLTDEIIARIKVAGGVELECLRCLRQYPESFSADFSEEFRIAHDVRTGNGIAGPADDERFDINEYHELDFGEALRQEIIVALPMRPTCGTDCPGPDVIEVGDDEQIDDRFASLAQLLDEARE